jgi:hypothetical protein
MAETPAPAHGDMLEEGILEPAKVTRLRKKNIFVGVPKFQNFRGA